MSLFAADSFVAVVDVRAVDVDVDDDVRGGGCRRRRSAASDDAMVDG